MEKLGADTVRWDAAMSFGLQYWLLRNFDDDRSIPSMTAADYRVQTTADFQRQQSFRT